MANELLSSREAARRLGVSAATLYAYVSRGLLRSEAVNGRRERHAVAHHPGGCPRNRYPDGKRNGKEADDSGFGDYQDRDEHDG